jgi:toxin ParE1/3/4
LTDVYFSPRAQADIRLIAERLAEESELKSSIFRSRLADAVRSLSIFPERGRKRDDLSPGYRSIPVDPVVIVYRIAADAVEVVRVIDGRRDFGTIFGGG